MRDQAATNELYELLPAVYRLRDAELGHPLRGLLAVIAEQVDVVRDDITGLWDDLFIETCADWVIPYIGDLVGNVPLNAATTAGPLGGTGQRPRADVAKTISYRRRKGTLPMLEELTRDVTGWGAHAVAFFDLLGWTQHPDHVRIDPQPDPLDPSVRPRPRDPAAADRVGTANVRHADLMDRVQGPFDRTAHTADVRPIGRRDGWHGIGKVGLFVWRLTAYPVRGATARRAAAPNAHGWHLSPLGNPAPLFTRSAPEPDPTGLAGERNVPGPIRPLAFRADPGGWYGPQAGLSLNLVRDGAVAVPVDAIVARDLTGWHRPPPGKVAVDVRLGRATFAAGEEPSALTADLTYGFSADLGGGPYDRRRHRTPSEPYGRPDTIAVPDALDALFTVPSQFATAQEALDAWNPGERPRAVIQIEDSRTHPGFTIAKAGVELVIQAAPNQRPVVAGNVIVTGNADRARLVLDGLLIAGGVELTGTRGEVELRHCTLVPGRTLDEGGRPADPAAPSLSAVPENTGLRVVIEHSITGALRLPPEMLELVVRDSIVDAVDHALDAVAAPPDGTARPGPAAVLERVTVFGGVRVRELTMASEVLFTAPVIAARRQGGCVRFSFVPEGSEAPRRYRCQPDLLLERAARTGQPAAPAALAPAFTAVQYGHPGYAQLAPECPPELRTGAEDGSEMGAYSRLRNPQREANLRTRLTEYLPFGLDAGLIYVT